MNHRKLRISWSVTWGVVAMLLVAWLLRSYWANYQVLGKISDLMFMAESEKGYAMLSLHPRYPATLGFSWVSRPISTDQPDIFAAKLSSMHLGIQWVKLGSGVRFAFSILWLIAIAVALGSARWARWPKRFSLRTLLIVTTLIAALLGLIVWLR